MPFGEKHYFNREQFEADLKRIEAFYRDRGFPDAQVSVVRRKLNDEQNAVKVAVTISEGRADPSSSGSCSRASTPARGSIGEPSKPNLPLKQGAPLDRALVQASREAALDELKDHGYPYATVRLAEEPGASERLRVITLQATPGALAHFGPIDDPGQLDRQ